MNLKDIEYVSMINEEKSFSAASERLFISQPALSLAIKKLEQELGVVLFNRTTSYVELSEAGRLFLTEGKEILRSSHQLKTMMKHLSVRESGNLRIGISTFYSSYYLAQFLPAFHSLHSEIHVSILEGRSHELEKLAVKEEVDFSLIPMPFDHEDLLDYTILNQEQIFFALPSDSPLRSKVRISMGTDFPFIDLSDVSQEPFIFLRPDQRFYKTAMGLCKEAGFTPKILYELSNWDAIHALIGKGVGVGFVPELVTRHLWKDIPKPIYCKIMNQMASRPYAIAYKKERKLSAAAQTFLSFLESSRP